MHTIDGTILKSMLLSASNNLFNHYPEIDALNVFPVPDGDTGMNMNLTISSGAKEIQNRSDNDVSSIASYFSRGLLMGARGNSGVILSQIFRGFASALKDKKEISANEFVDALSNGSQVAYKAVLRPVEGTILTVIRESSFATKNKLTKSSSFEEMFKILLSEANKSLNHTPDLLPILKEVGVVDSGGAGLVKVFEGMASVVDKKFVDKASLTRQNQNNEDGNSEKYRITFVLEIGRGESKKAFSEKSFVNLLKSRGEDVEVTSKDKYIKVEVSASNPGRVLTFAQGYGEFISLDIKNESPVEEVDFTKNQQEVTPIKDYAIVTVSAGAGINELFKRVGADEVVQGGQTMNPSIQDIVEKVKSANAKVVYILPNNSNIVMAAIQAADVLHGEVETYVISTKTIPQGIVACSAFNPDASVDENLKEMKSAVKSVKSGSITYSIKDTVIDGVEVTKNHFMALNEKNIICCEKSATNALYKLIEAMINEDSYLATIICGEDVKESEREEIESTLSEKYPDVEFEIVDGGQPVYNFLIGIE